MQGIQGGRICDVRDLHLLVWVKRAVLCKQHIVVGLVKRAVLCKQHILVELIRRVVLCRQSYPLLCKQCYPRGLRMRMAVLRGLEM